MSRPVAGQNVGNKAAHTGSRRAAEGDGDLRPSHFKKYRRSEQSPQQEQQVQAEDAPKEESEPPAMIKVRKPGQVRTPPPDAPAGLTAKTHLLPPDVENVELRKGWDIDAIAITKNSTIKNAVVRTIAALGSSTNPPSNKEVLVALMARAESANTCISIVEIVKREIQSKQQSWFQYTTSWSRLETFPDEKLPPAKAKDVKSEADEDDGTFQTLQRSDRRRVRNIPCLVVYLSLEQVPVLRDLYG